MKTHCPVGHPYEGDNLLQYGSNRKCRTCKNSRQRRGLRPCKHCTTPTARRTYCLNCVPATPDRRVWVARIAAYGVDKSMYDAMYFDQDGKCAITSCTNEATHVDHCHKTGKVRGLLCHKCNTGLHYLEDAEWRIHAQNYVEEANR
jgi:hypothetical protein